MRDIIGRNPRLTTVVVGGIAFAIWALINGVATATTMSELLRESAVGGAGLAFSFAPPVYRKLQDSSVVPLRESYTGPKWPVLLASGRSDVYMRPLETLIKRIREQEG